MDVLVLVWIRRGRDILSHPVQQPPPTLYPDTLHDATGEPALYPVRERIFEVFLEGLVGFC